MTAWSSRSLPTARPLPHCSPPTPPKMSLDPPTYILSFQNNIRARPISWEGAVRAKTISDSDLKKIKAIDKVRQDQRRQTIEADLDGYSTLLLGSADGQQPSIFQSAAKRSDIVQYMLVLAGDLVDGMGTLVILRDSEPGAWSFV
jgi:V-type H+-transporting ATPase subunit H